jgi:hypothetical protein
MWKTGAPTDGWGKSLNKDVFGNPLENDGLGNSVHNNIWGIKEYGSFPSLDGSLGSMPEAADPAVFADGLDIADGLLEFTI